METFLQKSYKMVSADENYNDFLIAIGMNSFCRFLAKRSTTTTKVAKVGSNEYELHLATTFATRVQKFVPNQVKEIQYIDGRRFKNVFEFEGKNKLIEKQIEENREVTIIREFTENEMLGVIIVGNVKTRQRSVLQE